MAPNKIPLVLGLLAASHMPTFRRLVTVDTTAPDKLHTYDPGTVDESHMLVMKKVEGVLVVDDHIAMQNTLDALPPVERAALQQQLLDSVKNTAGMTCSYRIEHDRHETAYDICNSTHIAGTNEYTIDPTHRFVSRHSLAAAVRTSERNAKHEQRKKAKLARKLTAKKLGNLDALFTANDRRAAGEYVP